MIRGNFSTALAVILILLSAAVLSAQVQIDTVEVNQAIGIQKNNAKKYVAGKDTVIRAFLAAPATIQKDQTSARITRDGQVVATLAPNAYDSETPVVDFQCPNREACGNWAAGAYSFEVTVNGTAKTTSETPLNFVERTEIRILAVPVKANYGGTIVPVTDTRWKTFATYLKRTYPVADDKLIWVTREELDASELDLETDAGRLGLWEKLEKLIPSHCTSSPTSDGCFQQVFGFIMARPNGYPTGTLQGYTYGKPANIGVITDEDAEATVAHEIGHTYGLGDTYDGGSFHCAVNPAPDEFEGKDFNDPSKTVKCTSGRNALPGVGGTKINAREVHPYEVGGRGALPDTAEYMGSGGRQEQFWTTQEAYDRLFDALAPTPPAPSNFATIAAVQRFIEIFGMIRQNASQPADVILDPWWTFEDDGSIPNTTGRYMVAAANAAGTRLATRAISPNFDPPGPKGLPSPHVDPAPFEAEMAFPEGTTKFQIIRDGVVVREVPVSANAPAVRNVAPQAVGTLNAPLTVTWDASDADGDTLTYTVEYNRDVSDELTSDWGILERDLTQPRFTIDFSDLPGGTHARLRITATDGIHSNDAESGEFVVPSKPPEVFIDESLNGKGFRVGQEIVLDGEAEDLQDEIAESQLQWSSNISGILGTGAPLRVASLPAGLHTITLTATNPDGLKGSASVSIRVGNPPRRRSARR